MKDCVVSNAKKPVKRYVQRQRIRQELRAKLREYNFTHFITLASNHQPLGYLRMRYLLKGWDARVNREINGPKWGKRPDERLVWFAFPEKLDVNPHWHMLVEVDPCIENKARATRTLRLPEIGAKHWLELLYQGSFNCQSIETSSVIEYCTKMIGANDNLEKFVSYREFMNN